MKLGINIDHIAVLREARKINSPNLLTALEVLYLCDVDYITAHLRKDRRHIHDSDIYAIKEYAKLPLNLEMSIDNEISAIALEVKPNKVTIVPENREEVTTEGGLDIFKHKDRLKELTKQFHNIGIEVFYFLEPNKEAVTLAKELGANGVELHTGKYSNIYEMLNSDLAKTRHSIRELELDNTTLKKLLNDEVNALSNSAKIATKLGLNIAAGHGLNYDNITKVTKIKQITELNIGQSIVAKAIYVGLKDAIIKMQRLVK